MSDQLKSSADTLPEVLRHALSRTPARLFAGRAGNGYSTATTLQLRADHAAARDAVYDSVDLVRDFGIERVNRYGFFAVNTSVADRTEYLMRPDRGRLFSTEAEMMIQKECPRGCDLQIVLGDGLSATAVSRYGSQLLDQLWERAYALSWTLGKPFLVNNCRVGILNEIGRLLQPKVVVLLIGERPGLAQSASLSAYFAYQPQTNHTDAQRNLISNIHAQGVSPSGAVVRLTNLAALLMQKQCSGVEVKEDCANDIQKLRVN
jgi:ethanolamine ammonia-lyase small subunit